MTTASIPTAPTAAEVLDLGDPMRYRSRSGKIKLGLVHRRHGHDQR